MSPELMLNKQSHYSLNINIGITKCIVDRVCMGLVLLDAVDSSSNGDNKLKKKQSL